MVNLEKILKKQSSNEEDISINSLYFNSLLDQINVLKESVELSTEEKTTAVKPLPICSEDEMKVLTIQDYEELSSENEVDLKATSLIICKMQAGLGTSVKRDDLLKKYSSRVKLGSKGTDLFILYNDHYHSLAEVQLFIAEDIASKKRFKSVEFLNLMNSETSDAVMDIWGKNHPGYNKTFQEVFSSLGLKRLKEINQLMMPTIDERGELTDERLAPGGHAFLGFYFLWSCFHQKIRNDAIVAIGNGEDIRSLPDDKIFSWVEHNDVPVVMVTTTKLEKDKKGGQIAIVNDSTPFVSIIEKAQAEKNDQLEYFEKLGLRDGDKRSLFNTNIVILNLKALNKRLLKLANISSEDFAALISPALIQNTKVQNGKKFVQLEGAIGSSLLNLDKYFRQNHNESIVSFLNLAPENRERFFMPIKKRKDFDEIYRGTY
jgi:hypothetical protein